MSDLSNKDSNIDEQFRKHQGDWDQVPGESAWEGLSDRLDQHEAKGSGRRRKIVRFSAAASLALLIAVTFISVNQLKVNEGFQAHTVDLEVPSYDGTEYERPNNGDLVKPPAEVRSRAASQIAETATDEFNMDTRIKSVPEDQVVEATVATRNPEQAEFEPSPDLEDRSFSFADKEETESTLDEVVIEEVDDHEIADADIVSNNNSSSGAVSTDAPEALTEAVVANVQGIEATKKAHKEKDDRGKRGATYKAEDEIAIAPSATGESNYSNNVDAFISESIIIRVPVNDVKCPIRSFWMDGSVFYSDPCANSADEVMKINGHDTADAAVLQRIVDLGADGLRALVRQSEQDGCGLKSAYIEINFRRGTPLSYIDEQIRIPIDDCVDKELKSLVDDLLKLPVKY